MINGLFSSQLFLSLHGFPAPFNSRDVGFVLCDPRRCDGLETGEVLELREKKYSPNVLPER